MTCQISTCNFAAKLPDQRVFTGLFLFFILISGHKKDQLASSYGLEAKALSRGTFDRDYKCGVISLNIAAQIHVIQNNLVSIILWSGERGC